MPVVQPVLGTVTNIKIYMIIVGKSMPIDNYEQYKRVINVINQITGRLYILETKKKFYFGGGVGGGYFQSASEPCIKLCFEAGK